MKNKGSLVLAMILLLLGTTELFSQSWVRYQFIYPEFIPVIDSTYTGKGVKLTSNNPNYKSFWESHIFTKFDDKSFTKLEDYYKNSPHWDVTYIKICEFSFENKAQKDSFINDIKEKKFAWTYLFITLPDEEMLAEDDVVEDDVVEDETRKLVEEGEVSDVLTFTTIRDESVYFSAVASTSSNEIMNTQAATLSSNTISEEASYTWFDAAMDTIGSGRQLTVQPSRSQTYTLKIQQSNNGYVASDTVSVRVLDGRITTITPNPATSLTVIAYELSENKSANITITDVSNTIRQTYPLNQSNGTLTISVDNMPKGVYYVTLNVDGAVADTKSLIIR